jgi:hypothetical protein
MSHDARIGGIEKHNPGDLREADPTAVPAISPT